MDTPKSDEQKAREREVIPGTPIVRGNTPRPFMHSAITTLPQSQLPPEPIVQETQEIRSTLSTFPAKPPSAPPLPEEPDDFGEQDEHLLAGKRSLPSPEAQGFAWLFEYGLEMDSSVLNTPERLDGLALLYGPAVLKGYRLHLGSYEVAGRGERTALTLLSDPRPHAEVWGVLYRVPQHVVQTQGEEPALADIVHEHPQAKIQAIHVFVQETYRKRTVPCTTYGWQDATLLQASSAQAYETQEAYVRRLTSIARKQRLPDTYIERLARLLPPVVIPHTPSAQHTTGEPILPPVTQRGEQSTEPLVLPIEKLEKVPRPQGTPARPSQVQRVPIKAYPQRGFVAFALYLFCLLLIVLALAVIQGLGFFSDVLNDSFTLLNVPWLVLVYGLLGGCISSIITLGRSTQTHDIPVFSIITWFARPFVGAILALFAYLLLTSGVFLAVDTPTGGHHETLFLLVGALAGMCEGWLFLRK